MQRSEIEQLLPEVLRGTATPGSPLDALLEAMLAMLAPSEALLSRIDEVFDPYRTPEAFLPVLATWVGMGHLLQPESASPGFRSVASGEARLRDLIAAAGYLEQWRGTAHGLVRFLETATGEGGFIVEEPEATGEDGQSFHIRVLVPPDASRYGKLVERIVETEKPAFVTFDIVCMSPSESRS